MKGYWYTKRIIKDFHKNKGLYVLYGYLVDVNDFFYLRKIRIDK